MSHAFFFFEILFWSSLCLGGDGPEWLGGRVSNETKDVFQ